MIGLLAVGKLLQEAGVGVDVVERLALVTVVFTLFIYALVIVACLKLRGTSESDDTFRANTGLLYLGIVGNFILLGYVVYDDPTSLLWCAGLLVIGGSLYVMEKLFGGRDNPDPTTGA